MNLKNILLFIIIFMMLIQVASAVTPIPDYDFDKHFTNLSQSNFSLDNMTTLGAATYEDKMGAIFWGVLFALIFGVMWITTEDITIPSIIGMLIGGSIWSLFPADWVPVAMSLFVVSMAGLIFAYLKKG